MTTQLLDPDIPITDSILGEYKDIPVIVSEEQVRATSLSIIASNSETAEDALARIIQTYRTIKAMRAFFEHGIDYGDVKDKQPHEKGYKPSLLLPGMEKARGLLGLREEYRDISVTRDFTPSAPFFFYEVECVLYHIATGVEVARGQAICHTRESSFMRQASRVCPECGKTAIKKGKYPPKGAPAGTNGGWYCDAKAEGCGKNFMPEDPQIIGQEVGSINDPQQVWDGLNRARKIANKRAFGDAIKRIAMLSSFFTVDMEDEHDTPSEVVYTQQPDKKQKPPTSSAPVQASSKPNPKPQPTPPPAVPLMAPQPPSESRYDGISKPKAADQAPYTPAEAKALLDQKKHHWSDDHNNITFIVENAKNMGYGDDEKSLLALLAVPDWKSFASGQIAWNAIKDAHTKLAEELKAKHLAKAQQPKPEPVDPVQTILPEQWVTDGEPQKLEAVKVKVTRERIEFVTAKEETAVWVGTLPELKAKLGEAEATLWGVDKWQPNFDKANFYDIKDRPASITYEPRKSAVIPSKKINYITDIYQLPF